MPWRVLWDLCVEAAINRSLGAVVIQVEEESMSTRERDPWVDVKTYHGLPADQVISALQKEIRRGNTENAVLLAYEMITTSAAMEDYLW